MTITLRDPALIAELIRANKSVELHDPEGRVIGRFTPETFGMLPPGVRSPFSEKEMEERRKDQTGRPLADILRDLEAGG